MKEAKRHRESSNTGVMRKRIQINNCVPGFSNFSDSPIWTYINYSLDQLNQTMQRVLLDNDINRGFPYSPWVISPLVCHRQPPVDWIQAWDGLVGRVMVAYKQALRQSCAQHRGNSVFLGRHGFCGFGSGVVDGAAVVSPCVGRVGYYFPHRCCVVLVWKEVSAFVRWNTQLGSSYDRF